MECSKKVSILLLISYLCSNYRSLLTTTPAAALHSSPQACQLQVTLISVVLSLQFTRQPSEREHLPHHPQWPTLHRHDLRLAMLFC
jgi:hypothetical protein